MIHKEEVVLNLHEILNHLNGVVVLSKSLGIDLEAAKGKVKGLIEELKQSKW